MDPNAQQTAAVQPQTTTQPVATPTQPQTQQPQTSPTQPQQNSATAFKAQQFNAAINFAKQNPNDPRSLRLMQLIQSGQMNDYLTAAGYDPAKYVKGYQAQQPQQPGGMIGAVSKSFTSGMKADTEAHAANITEDLSQKPSFTGALDVAGNVAGEALDPFGEALKAVTPQPVKDALSSAAKSVAGTPEAQNMIKAWNGFQAKYPDVAKDIGNAVNIAALFGGGEATKPVAQAADEGLQTAKSAITDTANELADNASANAAAKTAASDSAKTWEMIKPNLTTTELAEASKAGKITTDGVLGTVKQVPTGRDLDMIEAATPYVKDAKNSIEAVANMQDGIAEEATKLKDGLDDTGAIYSKSQIKGALDKLEPPTMVASDQTLNRAYTLVKNKMLDLVGSGGKLGDLLDARKDFDAFISKQFPNLYNSDTLTPMRQAIKDIRGTVNDVIASRLPDGTLPDGTNFRDSLQKQSLLYDAIDNTAAKTPKVGTNAVTQFVKAHPTAAKIAGAAVGGGAAVGVGKEFLGL